MTKFIQGIPEGDNRMRNVRGTWGFVTYENPKIIVGCMVAAGDRVLMGRGAIEPRHGFLTLPAGYTERGETPEEGAAREARAVIAL